MVHSRCDDHILLPEKKSRIMRRSTRCVGFPLRGIRSSSWPDEMRSSVHWLVIGSKNNELPMTLFLWKRMNILVALSTNEQRSRDFSLPGGRSKDGMMIIHESRRSPKNLISHLPLSDNERSSRVYRIMMSMGFLKRYSTKNMTRPHATDASTL